MAQLRTLNEISSDKDLAIHFLEKLPRSFSTHPLKTEIHGYNENGHNEFECPERKEKEAEKRKDNSIPEFS